MRYYEDEYDYEEDYDYYDYYDDYDGRREVGWSEYFYLYKAKNGHLCVHHVHFTFYSGLDAGQTFPDYDKFFNLNEYQDPVKKWLVDMGRHLQPGNFTSFSWHDYHYADDTNELPAVQSDDEDHIPF